MPNLIICKASAGSGKTFTLAVKYIGLLLLNPYEYQHILAVTFTNKATAEMKERIISQLYGIWQGHTTSDSYLEAIQADLRKSGESALAADHDEIRRRARLALLAILHDYSHFRVETIDSFFQSILHGLARELGLNARLQVDLDQDQMLSDAVGQIIEDTAPDSPLTQPQRDRLRKDVMQLVQQNLDDGKNWNVEGRLNGFGKHIFNDQYLAQSEALAPLLADTRLMEQYIKDIQAPIGQFVTQVKELRQQFEKALQQHGFSYADFSRQGDGLKNYFNAIDACKEPTDSQKKWVESSDPWFKKDTLKKNPGWPQIVDRHLLPILQQIETFRAQDSKALITSRLIQKHLRSLRLLSTIDAKVKDLSGETGRFLLSETPILLNRLIENDDAPFIFERLGSQLHHVMIDEFQDTSRLQWNNFSKLLQDIIASHSGNLIVGDVKQSIYRWRSGDWQIMLGLDHAFHSVGVLPLDTNRRSEQHIITFNNRLFEGLRTQHTAIPQLQAIYEGVSQDTPPDRHHDPQGYVEVNLLTDKDCHPQIYSQMRDAMQNLHHQGVAYNDMVIIVRTRTALEDMLEWFAREAPQIPFISDEVFLLENAVAVQLLIAALTILNTPDDRIAWSVLIHLYQTHICHQPTQWNIPPSTATGSTPDLQSLQDLLPQPFLSQFETLRLMPLYELNETLSSLFRLEVLNQQDAYLFDYFDQILQYTTQHQPNLHDFLDYWQQTLHKTAIHSDGGEGIRILTIHQSKGLQRHTVFIPFADWSMIDYMHETLLWCHPTQAPYDTLPLLPIKFGKDMKHSIFDKEFAEEYNQQFIDNVNLLYVALTRPEKNLYIWGKAPTGKGDTPTISKLLSSVLTTWPETETDSQKNLHYRYGQPYVSPTVPTHTTPEDTTPKDYNPLLPTYQPCPIHRSSQKFRISFMQSSDSRRYIDTENDAEKQTADQRHHTFIQQGILLHDILSRMTTLHDLDTALHQLLLEGIISSRQQSQHLRAILQKGLSDPEFADWFHPRWHVFNECTIASLQPSKDDPQKLVVENKRTDRVIMDQHTIKVIDFKFGRPSEDHRRQVRHYMQLMQGLYPHHHVTGYLWYGYDCRIEPVLPHA